MAGNEILDASLEYIEDALDHLESDGFQPGVSAKSDLDEVVHVEDNPPAAVVNARDAIDQGDLHSAKQFLESYLDDNGR